ncbi:MAG: aldo/keto reductase [bacterium]|jgi:predicted aldo/keto reductase-like oxidoreductase
MLEKRRLGRTGLEVSCLGFGGIPIQRIGKDQAVSVVREAVALGVDFIDTARGYGDSEEKIGAALAGLDAEVVLASKTPRRDPEGVRSDFELSLSRLGVDRIDLYQLHCVNKEEDYGCLMAAGGGVEVLEGFRKEGRLGSIGITSHHLDIFKTALEDDGFDTVQVLYNFLEPEAADEVIPMAVERDVGVIAMKPLAGGVITDYDIAIRHALLIPQAVVIPGPGSVDEVRMNVAAASADRVLSDRDLARIEEVRRRAGRLYCRRCDYCQPCESGIPISFLLHMKTIRERIGDVFIQQDVFRDLLEKARGCTECGECAERCPFDLPVPELVKQARRFLEEVLK